MGYDQGSLDHLGDRFGPIRPFGKQSICLRAIKERQNKRMMYDYDCETTDELQEWNYNVNSGLIKLKASGLDDDDYKRADSKFQQFNWDSATGQVYSRWRTEQGKDGVLRTLLASSTERMCLYSMGKQQALAFGTCQY